MEKSLVGRRRRGAFGRGSVVRGEEGRGKERSEASLERCENRGGNSVFGVERMDAEADAEESITSKRRQVRLVVEEGLVRGKKTLLQ